MEKDETNLAEEAKAYIKKKKQKLLENFCSLKKYPPAENSLLYLWLALQELEKRNFPKSSLACWQGINMHRKL